MNIKIFDNISKKEKADDLVLFHFSTLKKSYFVTEGFIQLLKLDNFDASYSLIRINLEVMIRVYALDVVESKNKYASDIIHEDKELNKFLYHNCEEKGIITERSIVKKLSKLSDFNWVEKTYNQGNFFTHFSNRSLYSSMEIEHNEKSINLHWGNILSITDKQKAINIMCQIIKGIHFFTQKHYD